MAGIFLLIKALKHFYRQVAKCIEISKQKTKNHVHCPEILARTEHANLSQKIESLPTETKRQSKSEFYSNL